MNVARSDCPAALCRPAHPTLRPTRLPLLAEFARHLARQVFGDAYRPSLDSASLDIREYPFDEYVVQLRGVPREVFGGALRTSLYSAPLAIHGFGCILRRVKGKKKIDSGRAKLEKELRESLAEIDEEGLLFLLRQAQVLIYNARVDRINQEATKLKGGKPKPAREVREAPLTVSIEESGDGKSIFLTLGKARKVLAPEEMRQLVRICYAAETKSEALRQLFTVLARERKDILADAMIGNPDNPLLVALFTTVRNTYRLKDS